MKKTMIDALCQRKRESWVLLGILLSGLLMRIYHLQSDSFSAGESFFFDIHTISYAQVFKIWHMLGQTGIYYAFIKMWSCLVGVTEFSLRFPSVVFGCFSILLVFSVGKSLFNSKVGLFASFLFAINNAQIYSSQLAKPYSMSVLFSLLSFYYFIKALNSNERRLWILYSVTLCVCLSLHPINISILCVQSVYVIYLVITKKIAVRHAKSFLIAAGSISVLYFPIALFMLGLFYKHYSLLDSIASAHGDMLSIVMSIGNIINYFGVTMFDEIIFRRPSNIQIGLSLGYLILSVAVFFAGIFSIIKSNKRDDASFKKGTLVLLILWLTMPIGIVFSVISIVSYVSYPILYILYASAPFYFIIAKGIFVFRRKMRNVLIVLFVLINAIMSGIYIQSNKRLDWRNACHYVRQNIEKGERTICLIPNASEYRQLLWYNAPALLGLRLARREGLPTYNEFSQDLEIINKAELDSLSYRGVWLVFRMVPDDTEVNTLINFFKIKYREVNKYQFDDIEIYHFKFLQDSL